jgi:cellulose biosynthesis protein BcsQ
MKTVCFFNNKGGVGKTTLVCNIAANFAKNFSKRVLLIDCDPQCNSTQLILGDDAVADLYWPDKRDSNETNTIIDVISPIQDGDATINLNVTPSPGSSNRFNLDIIPGHPRFSVIEDKLSQAWYEAIGGDIGGIRKTNWCSILCQSFAKCYDVIFIDLGPSLGSINRTVLLGSDFFVTPMRCDILSIVGIRNIADWLRQWISLYENGIKICEERNPGRLKHYKDIKYTGVIVKGYAGYTLQQYIAKSKEGVRRPTKAFERILENVPNEICTHLGDFFAKNVNIETAKLGDVPHMFSLVPLAQSVNAPIFALSSADGLVGSQYRQVYEYAILLNALSEAIARNIGIEIQEFER